MVRISGKKPRPGETVRSSAFRRKFVASSWQPKNLQNRRLTKGWTANNLLRRGYEDATTQGRRAGGGPVLSTHCGSLSERSIQDECDFHKRRRADSLQAMYRMSSRRRNRTYVSADLPGSTAVVEVNQAK